MASRWSSEQVVAEYGQAHALSMAVDCNGKHALLAGRRQLYLVDLDQPKEALAKSQRQSKWDVSSIQWHPFTSHSSHFVSACNQRADVCKWSDSNCEHLGSLKGHTRVISDLDWSPHEASSLATSSVDTFTYIWDIKEYRKPSIALQAVASVSQVKWNRVNPFLLATAHDGDIRIWDTRKGSSPVIYIAAHPSKIHGLDWSNESEYHLASSSQDCSVKAWNVMNPRQPETKLRSELPVWKARYTPFGKGLITVMVPQLRRGENSLCLWYMEDLKQPVHTFVGHTDVVLDFYWRRKGEETQDYQLVTWSKDQTLRLWMIDPQLQKLCGEIFPEPVISSTPSYMETASLMSEPYSQASVVTVITPAEDNKENEKPIEPSIADNSISSPVDIAKSKSSKDGEPSNSKVERSQTEESRPVLTPPSGMMPQREEIHSPMQPKSLHQELSLINIDIPYVTVEEMDAFTRTMTVSARVKSKVTLTMTFPDEYPVNVPPRFSFDNKKTTIDKEAQEKLSKVLSNTSKQHVKYSRSCIEPCIRQLVHELNTMAKEDKPKFEESGIRSSQEYSGIYTFGTFQDDQVPFPRTSGARFCGAGYLVCFTRRSDSGLPRRTSSTADINTPRAMSALQMYSHGHHPPSALQQSSFNWLARSPPTEKTGTISDYYFKSYNYKERTVSKRSTRAKSRLKDMEAKSKDLNASPKKQVKTGPVVIYNTECLLPIHRHLAEKYKIDLDNVVECCHHNANAALSFGRPDLAQMWSLAALSKSQQMLVDTDEDTPPWHMHPFGSKLLSSLIDHYCSIQDVQTLAMLCCIFGSKNKSLPRPVLAHIQVPPPSPLPPTSEQTVIQNKKKFQIKTHKGSFKSSPIKMQLNQEAPEPSSLSPLNESFTNGWSQTVSRMKRSNSWSEIREDFAYEESREVTETEKDLHVKTRSLLDPNLNVLYDSFKFQYANILYRWELLTKRAEILKYVSSPASHHSGPEFNNRCGTCNQQSRQAQCHECKTYIFQCAICRLSVKGCSSFCLACGHGGHASHWLDWFQAHDVCPTGCGCCCAKSQTCEENDVDNPQ